MKYRAVIFDVYRTLLRVGENRADAGERWPAFYESFFAGPPAMDFESLAGECEQRIREQHRQAVQCGVLHPEVCWRRVVEGALPELKTLGESQRERFLLEHIQLIRPVELMPGADRVLRGLADGGVALGIASNAQPYTLRELAASFKGTRAGLELFDPELSFWSFDHGFSKPNPHAFRILTARLSLRGILPEETMMAGDRVENDLLPAKCQGWGTWMLNVQSDEPWDPAGDWEDLGRHLELKSES